MNIIQFVIWNNKESEVVLYKYFKEHIDDVDVLGELNSYNPDEEQFPDIKYLQKTKIKVMNMLNVGLTRLSLPKHMFSKRFIEFKGYNVLEKISYLIGMISSGKKLMPTMLASKLDDEISELSIPVLFIHGKFDYQVSGELSRAFFEKLHVPQKEFIILEESAHSPHFEEATVFTEVVHNFIQSSI